MDEEKRKAKADAIASIAVAALEADSSLTISQAVKVAKYLCRTPKETDIEKAESDHSKIKRRIKE